MPESYSEASEPRSGENFMSNSLSLSGVATTFAFYYLLNAVMLLLGK